MKRRNFLSLSAAGIGMAGLSPASGAVSGRLYGTPIYANDQRRALGEDRMRLTLSRMEMPVEAWEPLMKMSRLWNAVLRNDATRKEFQASPRRFLVRNDIPLSVMKRSPQEFQLLQVICDPYVRHVAGSGNYRAFISHLSESNLLHNDAEDSLKNRIRSLIETDVEQLRAQLTRAGVSGTELSDLQGSADLYFIMQELSAVNSTTQAVIAAAVIAVVAVVVATFVAVGVNVIAALNLGFAISIAISAAIFTGGFGSCDNCHADVGVLANLEPKMRDNLNLTIRAARLTGQPTFEIQALKDYINTETRACLEAAESLAVLSLPKGREAREAVLEGVGRLTCQAAGLT